METEQLPDEHIQAFKAKRARQLKLCAGALMVAIALGFCGAFVDDMSDGHVKTLIAVIVVQLIAIALLVFFVGIWAVWKTQKAIKQARDGFWGVWWAVYGNGAVSCCSGARTWCARSMACLRSRHRSSMDSIPMDNRNKDGVMPLLCFACSSTI